MKALVFAVALTGFASAAMAAEPVKTTKAPVKLTEAQMDNVTAGALLNVVAIDVLDVNNNQVQVAVPVTAAVTAQVGILSQQIGSAAAGQTGRIGQRR